MNLTIGWLYPDLMSTYGDRGNIIVLKKRFAWRGIEVKVKRISIKESAEEINDCDLLFMGGAQDIQQEIVNRDLQQQKGKIIIEALEKNIPGLFICGAYQFLGKFYKAADGTIIKGLSFFDLYTENPGLNVKRLIGNVIIESSLIFNSRIVGFENHGGRTYLGNKKQAFAKVNKGFGNNGEDGTEGIIYKNAIGTYLHGPILPKNPELADYLIEKALSVKYKEEVKLSPLDDSLELKAKQFVINKYFGK
jgi:lipid II isoglutaminyl synthase (glutamine-hydrolysing)